HVLVALEDTLSDEYSILKAPTASEALQVVDNVSDIAVILTDQRMPEMTGDELLTRLSPNHPAQRILVTGYADLSAVIRAVNDGSVFAYITRPWDSDDLLAKVNTAVGHYRLALELRNERQLLRDLMDNAPDGIAFRDVNRRFQRVNAPFAAMVGAASPQ